MRNLHAFFASTLQRLLSNREHREILRRGFTAVLLRFLGAALGFLNTILLARFLGATDAGIYLLALTVVTISSIIGRFGLDNALVRFAAADAALRSLATVRSLYRKSIAISSLVSGLVTGIVLLGAPWIAEVVFSEPNLVQPLRLMSVGILPASLLNLHAELLKGLDRIRDAMLVQGVAVPLLITVGLLLMAVPFGLLGAVSAYVLAASLTFLLGYTLWRSNAPTIRGQAEFDTRLLVRAALPLLSVALMNVVIGLTDIIMIGIFLDSSSVGIYGNAARIAALGSLLLVATNSVVGPRFSALWASGEWDDLNALARFTTAIMAIIATLILLVFVLFPDTILGILGAEFVSGRTAFVILGIGQFFTLATGPVAILLMMTGNERFHRNNVTITAVTNVLLNLILIPSLDIQGAALATAISLLIKNVVAVAFVRWKLGIRVLL